MIIFVFIFLIAVYIYVISYFSDVSNQTYPLQYVTEISTKATTLSSSLESKTVGTIISAKETIATTLSIQPTSTINTAVYEVRTDKKLETITKQKTSSKIPVTRTSLSTETKEKRISLTNTTEIIDFISEKSVNNSSMTSVSVAEKDNQGNMSNKFTFKQSSAAKGNISVGRSRENFENYTPLAIGITITTLFGIGVIFFIVWIWARSQDKKRAMAEDEEVTQPITNAGSNCSF